MARLPILSLLVALSAGWATSCAETAQLPETAGFGPNPTLPPPVKSVVPTMKIAPAKGWPANGKPTPASGLAVAAFAQNLDHPRSLFVLPNGDVLVAETNAPDRPEEQKKLKGKIMGAMMKKAGAATPSANRITLLRDADHDGVAETREVFLKELHSPFGMALAGDSLFVANTDALMRFPYHPGDTHVSGTGTKVADLPGGPLNHHWTKSLVASADGKFLYVGVGSNSNVAENGIEEEAGRACILEVEVSSGHSRVFATGLRNPAALAWNPQSNRVWAAVNERDEIGSGLVPDYMTEVKDGAFYGWPYSYYGQHLDERVKDKRPDLVAKAIAPDYALGAHTACLGLVFADTKGLSEHYSGGAFVGQHGSWNRNPPSGYKVIFVRFTDGKPNGRPEEVLTGFLSPEGDAYGRPVEVALDKSAGLLVADDVGNTIWRVTAAR